MTIALPTVPVRKPRRSTSRTSSSSIACHLRSAHALTHQIKELEAQLLPHRAWLLAYMQSQDIKSLELDGLSVQRKSTSKWVYSAETQRDAIALKTAQDYEQSKGIATATTSVHIALTLKK